MKKYMTSYGAEIEEVECTKETEKTVWVLRPQFSIGKSKPPIERNFSKNSQYDNYHDTYELAKQFLINRALYDIHEFKERLEEAEDHLKKCQSLVER